MPEPHPGESLLSWVDALARVNRVSRFAALRLAGLIRSNAPSVQPPASFGFHVADTVARDVYLATGVPPERVQEMVLAQYAGRGLTPLPQRHPQGAESMRTWRNQQQMVLRRRSNACPTCLRGSGGRWLLKWRLAWAFACVHHQRYLISACRGCGAALHPLRPGTANSWICPGPAPGLGLFKPTRPCGRDIRGMRPEPVRDSQLLECQQRIDMLLEGRGEGGAGALDVFDALYRSLQDACSLVRPAALPDTDDVVRRAWDRFQAPEGCKTWREPLIVAGATKIATGTVQLPEMFAVSTRMASRVLSAAKRTSRTSCAGFPGLGATE
ncbi:TniQ family protein [Streptomyces sp. NPDC058611]|uniref:TniQ family protein n=1 Tax=unclassified Streptomyces TaxID=2593676 RepID=UPI00364BB6C2